MAPSIEALVVGAVIVVVGAVVVAVRTDVVVVLMRVVVGAVVVLTGTLVVGSGLMMVVDTSAGPSVGAVMVAVWAVMFFVRAVLIVV